MMTCTLKPGSATCTEYIEKGITTTGCGGCPVSSSKTQECCSTHSGATIPKKDTATANAISAKNRKVIDRKETVLT